MLEEEEKLLLVLYDPPLTLLPLKIVVSNIPNLSELASAATPWLSPRPRSNPKEEKITLIIVI
jgi:hypothetical protein